jgi:hypothetical protein
MTFRLVYRGPLHANAGPKEKQAIRRSLHPQLADLWRRPPLASVSQQVGLLNPAPGPDILSIVVNRGGFMFAPLVTSRLDLVCHLEVLFLRPQDPGQLVQGGDLDNRVKTLFDALQIPDINQLVGDGPQAEETPFFCLLENDALITQFSIETDRLLEPVPDSHVSLVMRVRLRAVKASWISLDLVD